MKKNLIVSIIIIAIVSGVVILFSLNKKQEISGVSQCQTKEMIFYYFDECKWCQKVKDEGTIDKIKKLGVKVKEIDVDVGPIRHNFQGVPTFVINEKIYSGYKTFEDISDLLNCPKEKQNLSNQNQQQIFPRPIFQQKDLPEIEFIGEKGETVNLENSEIKLTASIFDDNQARFYNVLMSSGKTIYFFVVKDKQGIYHAAANACVVCFKTYKGFRQEGDEIVCNNCGNRYPIEKIATEKGGCNPGPINPNLEVKNGQIIIQQKDLEQVNELF